jgi:hypothetical protein
MMHLRRPYNERGKEGKLPTGGGIGLGTAVAAGLMFPARGHSDADQAKSLNANELEHRANR